MLFFFKLQVLGGLFLVPHPMPKILVPGGALGPMVRKTIMVIIKITYYLHIVSLQTSYTLHMFLYLFKGDSS